VAAIRTREPVAANDWRWKLVASVASVAAVAAVGWNVWGTAGAGAGVAGPQLAAAPMGVTPVAAASDPRAPAMLRDPRLDQLLAAHRQLGGATALQAPSGFLRNATFEGPAR
jgi:sigma-E factor negative regulatory protein RseA